MDAAFGETCVVLPEQTMVPTEPTTDIGCGFLAIDSNFRSFKASPVRAHSSDTPGCERAVLMWLQEVLQADRQNLEQRHFYLLELLQNGLLPSCRDSEIVHLGQDPLVQFSDVHGLVQTWTDLIKPEMKLLQAQSGQLPDTGATLENLSPVRPLAPEQKISAGLPHSNQSELLVSAPLPSVQLTNSGLEHLTHDVAHTVGQAAPLAPKDGLQTRQTVLERKLSFSDEAKAVEQEARQNTKRHLGSFETFVRGDRFEGMFAVLIFVNTLIMAVEAQYQGTLVGCRLGYFGYPFDDSPEDFIWPGALVAFQYQEMFFGVLFTVELVLKIVCFRFDFFQDTWNWIDAAIVVAWFVVTFGEGVSLPLDPMILRLARLARLLRLLRLVRTIKGFDALLLMTTAMKASISVLFWSAILLILVLMMCALFLQMTVADYIDENAHEKHRRNEVYQYYGTFARTMLTMFEITLGNWMPPCRALIENVDEAWMIFFLAHKLIIGFSVVSVITGIFIQETFKVATQDDRIMMMQKERAIKSHAAKMRKLFEHGDDDEDGALSLDEFRHACSDHNVRVWLSSMELDVGDVEEVFRLLDDGNGKLTVEELVKGVSKLRGAARSLDVASLIREIRSIHALDMQIMEQTSRISHERFSPMSGFRSRTSPSSPFCKQSIPESYSQHSMKVGL